MVDMAFTGDAGWNDQVHILVLEDEEPASPQATAISAALQAEGYVVEVAVGAADGLRRFASNLPSLVLLRTCRPGTRWIETCRQMQAQSEVPIIIGFRLQSEIDAVLAFELGVMGYISEPKRLRELVARVRAALRVSRAVAPQRPLQSAKSQIREDNRLVVGMLCVDFAGREVTMAGHAVHLPRQEFDLLALLLSPPGQVRTRNEILHQLWADRGLASSRTLDTHIRRLRLKLEDDAASPRHLVTVRGVGFRFDTDDDRRSSEATSSLC